MLTLGSSRRRPTQGLAPTPNTAMPLGGDGRVPASGPLPPPRPGRPSNPVGPLGSWGAPSGGMGGLTGSPTRHDARFINGPRNASDRSGWRPGQPIPSRSSGGKGGGAGTTPRPDLGGGSAPLGGAYVPPPTGVNWDSVGANFRDIDTRAGRYADDLVNSAGLGAAGGANAMAARGGGGAGSLMLAGAARNAANLNAGTQASGIRLGGARDMAQGLLATAGGQSQESLGLSGLALQGYEGAANRTAAENEWRTQLAENARQYDLGYGLDRDRFGESQSQWDDSYGLEDRKSVV